MIPKFARFAKTDRCKKNLLQSQHSFLFHILNLFLSCNFYNKSFILKGLLRFPDLIILEKCAYFTSFKNVLTVQFHFRFRYISELLFISKINFVYQKALIRTFHTRFLTKKITFVNSQH